MMSIGDRMKTNYESVTDIRLTRRTPVIVRVDGRCFHSICLDKPFDAKFIKAMQTAAQYLAIEMQGFKLGYVQSDEASFLLTDFDTVTTEAWFNYELRKLCSISAGLMTMAFNRYFQQPGCFDARAFNVPLEEVSNYFLWRCRDWKRNSVLMVGQAHFSHKELHGKNLDQINDMLHEKGIHWSGFSAVERRGTFIVKDGSLTTAEPVFSEVDRLVRWALEVQP